MYTKSNDYKIYLYEQIDTCFYWSDEKKADWLLATTNSDYIQDIVPELNERIYENKRSNSCWSVSVSEILDVILEYAINKNAVNQVELNKNIFGKGKLENYVY